MDKTELQTIIRREIETANSYMGDEVSTDRARFMDAYLSKPYGNEIQGRSQVVTSEVQNAIETVMPDLMQIFTAGSKAVEFEPQGMEDEEGSKQATDTVNYVWYQQNPGFLIFHDWFKDALLQINGFVKTWWDKSEIWKRETMTGLTEDEMVMILQDPDVELIEHSEEWTEEAKALMEGMGLKESDVTDEIFAQLPVEIANQAKKHDITIKRKLANGRVKVMNVPPEEMLFSQRERDLESARFLAHRTLKTVSELIEDGFDAEELKRIPTDSSFEHSTERNTRFDREWDIGNRQEIDESMREIEVHECFLRADWDDDGIAELRKVTVLGPNYEIFLNEPYDEQPFDTLTPIRMPHKILGRALADLAEDIQKIKTALWRQTLDNIYLINNGRTLISKKVPLDAILDNKVGSVIQVDTDMADVQGHAVPMMPNPIGAVTGPLLEYADTVLEQRTGVTRYSQGLDADALNKTASGINLILGRAQQRVLLIARVFAETGVKNVFKKILRLLINHADKELVIRLRNKWVTVDPRSWNSDMDMTVNVGLGYGTKEQQALAMRMLLEIQQAIIQYQGGADGPLVGLMELRNSLEKLTEALGLKSADPYFRPIEPGQPVPPRQDPKAEQMKAELQLKAETVKMDDQRERAKIYLEHVRELMQMGLEDARERAVLDMDAMRNVAEFGLKRRGQDLDAAARKEN